MNIYTVGLFLDLERDGLSGHLQQMDSLAQRLSFKADSVDGQDSVPYMDGPSPAGNTEKPDYTRPYHQEKLVRLPESLDWEGNKDCLLQKGDETAIVYSFIYFYKVPKSS